jgi:hypothetical protein
MNDEPQGGESQPPTEIIIEPDKLAGVWANFAQVSHTIHEFTVDFVRMDPTVPGRGIVVARVSVSPLFVTQLIEALGLRAVRRAARGVRSRHTVTLGP